MYQRAQASAKRILNLLKITPIIINGNIKHPIKKGKYNLKMYHLGTLKKIFFLKKLILLFYPKQLPPLLDRLAQEKAVL